MAVMCPEIPIGFDECSREDVIFEALSKLPDSYYVFHSVTLLTQTKYGLSEHETDFIVFHPMKGIMCIEAKAGQVHFLDGAWRYADGTIMKHNGPFKQASDFSHNLCNYVKNSKFGYITRKCKFVYAVCFPTVSKEKFGHPVLPPGTDYDLILFRESLDDIENCISKIFDMQLENVKINTFLSKEDERNLIEGILAPQLHLLPIPEMEAEHRNVRFKTMLKEQISLLDYLEEQKTAVISGAAGTGKTLMALEKARRNADLHEKVLFLCYNSKLNEHLRANYPHQYIDYYTIDGFACKVCNTHESDFNLLQEKLLEYIGNDEFPYNHIVIDEGQDFGQEKIEESQIIDLLYSIAYENDEKKSFYLFYDKNQLVQGYKLPDCIADADCKLTLYRNCRNTENIATSSFRFLGKTKTPKLFEKSIRGNTPVIVFAENEDEQVNKLNEMIDLYSESYKNNIVILTATTVEKSILSSKRDGNFYRHKGNKYLFTTCKKFKGLEADAIIMIDVKKDDFIDETAKNRIYVGTSRAKFELCVISDLSSNDIDSILEIKNMKKSKNSAKALATLYNSKLKK